MATVLEMVRAIVSFLLVQTGLFNVSNMTNDTLVPRALLFGNPERSDPSMSYDGRYVAFLAPNENGVQNVWMQPAIAGATPIQLTFDNARGIYEYHWTHAPNVLVFLQDTDGDENFKLYKLDMSNQQNLRPELINGQPDVQTIFLAVRSQQKNKLIFGANDGDPKYFNIYEFDFLTKQKRRILNNNRFLLDDLLFDNDLNLRIIGGITAEGGKIMYRPSDSANLKNLTSSTSDWIVYTTVSPEDYLFTAPIFFSSDNTQIYWIWGPGSDLGRLVVHPFGRPNENRVIYSPQKTEIQRVPPLLIHPVDEMLLAVVEQYHEPEVKILNETVKEDFEYLQRAKTDGIPLVLGTSADFMTWLIEYKSSEYPSEYWLYDRRQRMVKFLFSSQSQLKGQRFAKMRGVTVTARDGLPIPCYLSIPPTVAMSSQDPAGITPTQPQKFVLFVHGGPDMRDEYRFNSFIVWLTNRGYTTLQCNYRGSTGYGKRHVNAGNGEWGRNMQNDLIDAVNWAMNNGIADPQQTAIMGASYGGYATLLGLTFTPEKFRCGVELFGPTNLITFLDAIPPYWDSSRKRLTDMIGGDTDTEAGREFLQSRSPLLAAKNITKPLLILQGGNDARVQQSESDQFVKVLQDNNIPVRYILYPNEGHGFRRPENSISSIGFSEQLLTDCLHGRYEPYHIGMYNSSAVVVLDTLK